MVTRKYREYISSPKWRAKRQAAIRYYGRRCKSCGQAPKVIHVHHLDYRNLGNEPMTDLMILCADCHKKITAYHRRNRRKGLRRNTFYMIQVIKAEKKGKKPRP